jgi:AcrR family transcriptional regulator
VGEVPRKAGRPRDEGARKKVLTAALSLMSTEGLPALTMEGIAARAGVGKQTVYRWWNSRADILLEALRETGVAAVPVPNTGSLRDDLRVFVQSTFSVARDRWVMAPVLRALIAEAQSNESLRLRFREEVIESRRAALGAIFEIAIVQGNARPDFSPDVGVDMVFGAMWYRLLVGHLPIDDAFALVLADTVSRAAGTTQRVD